MPDSQCFNTSLLEGMISSKKERVFIRDVRDLTFEIVFDAGWASMNVDSKRPIAWNNSTHGPSWRFHLHCGIEETGSPGIICIICHQVLRHPSEHGTSSMGKHLLTEGHMATLNESTESEETKYTSSTVDEAALATLKRQGSRGIRIVCSQWEFIFDIQVDPYWLTWQTKRSKVADKDFETSRISPRLVESLPHVRICFGSYSMERDIKSCAAMVI